MNQYPLQPAAIEQQSFKIITEILGDKQLDPRYATIIKRVIHTTADFEYADNMVFVEGVVDRIGQALQAGTPIITDTKMAKAGINAAAITALGSQVHCFISDDDVIALAKQQSITRAIASIDKAAQNFSQAIFVVGNAPTALFRLCELTAAGTIQPTAVIGAPVGFVNVVEAKEMLLAADIPAIICRGRKGGSNVAAAIINAICYELWPRL